MTKTSQTPPQIVESDTETPLMKDYTAPNVECPNCGYNQPPQANCMRCGKPLPQEWI